MGSRSCALALALGLAACAPQGAGDGPERFPLGKADATGSCLTPEGDPLCGDISTGNCWCDDECADYDDCCADKVTVCGGAVDPAGLPPASQDWTRDVLSTELRFDLETLAGRAVISLAASDSQAASLDIGDLGVLAVSNRNGPLNYTVTGSRLDVGVPSTGVEASITVEYEFRPHREMQGYMRNGLTMLWPTFCGNLFPCKPDPDDGSTFTLALEGVPEGSRAVYPDVIPGDAPAYMPAFAVGDYTREELGSTSAGTELSVWFLEGDREDALTGTAHLVAAFDFYETTYGPYAYGPSAGSVSADWGGGDYGGMEHHPYWHVGRGTLDDEEVHIHEAGHGWFGNGVRIRCWEDFVLSEGTTTYITARAIEATQGADRAEEIWEGYREELDSAVRYENTVAWLDGCNRIDILNHPLWSNIPYMKGAFFLRDVAGQVGVERLDAALATFYRARVGSAAGMRDLLDTLRDETGFDPSDLAEAWLRRLDAPAY